MGTPDSIALRKAASVSAGATCEVLGVAPFRMLSQNSLGGYGLIEIVLERFIVNDVVEIDQLNTLLLDELQGKVAAGVDNKVALSGHGVPFQQAPYMRFLSTSALHALYSISISKRYCSRIRANYGIAAASSHQAR